MPDVSLDVTSYARYAVEMGEGDDPEQIVGGELIVVATYVPDAIGAPGCELSGSTEQMDIDQDPINLLYDLQPGQVFPEPVYFDQVRVGKFNLPTFYAELTLAEDGTTPRLLLHHQAIWEWFTKALAAFQPGESTWQSTVTAPLLALCHSLAPSSVDSIQ